MVVQVFPDSPTLTKDEPYGGLCPWWINPTLWAPKGSKQPSAKEPRKCSIPSFDYMEIRPNGENDYVTQVHGKSEKQLVADLKEYANLTGAIWKRHERLYTKIKQNETTILKASAKEAKYLQKIQLPQLRPLLHKANQLQWTHCLLEAKLQLAKINVLRAKKLAIGDAIKCLNGELPFAVLSECFFMHPMLVLKAHPQISMLQSFVSAVEKRANTAQDEFEQMKKLLHAQKLHANSSNSGGYSNDILSTYPMSPSSPSLPWAFNMVSRRLWGAKGFVPSPPNNMLWRSLQSSHKTLLLAMIARVEAGLVQRHAHVVEMLELDLHARFDEFVHYQAQDKVCMAMVDFVWRYKDGKHLVKALLPGPLLQRVDAFTSHLAQHYLQLPFSPPGLRILAHRFVFGHLGNRLGHLDGQRAANQQAVRRWGRQVQFLQRLPETVWGIEPRLLPGDGECLYSKAIDTMGYVGLCAAPHEMLMCCLVTVQMCAGAAEEYFAQPRLGPRSARSGASTHFTNPPEPQGPSRSAVGRKGLREAAPGRVRAAALPTAGGIFSDSDDEPEATCGEPKVVALLTELACSLRQLFVATRPAKRRPTPASLRHVRGRTRRRTTSAPSTMCSPPPAGTPAVAPTTPPQKRYIAALCDAKVSYHLFDVPAEPDSPRAIPNSPRPTLKGSASSPTLHSSAGACGCAPPPTSPRGTSPSPSEAAAGPVSIPVVAEPATAPLTVTLPLPVPAEPPTAPGHAVPAGTEEPACRCGPEDPGRVPGEAPGGAEVDDFVFGADKLFPILTYVVVQAGVPDFPACLSYMRRYLSDEDCDGELDYCLTTVCACLRHVSEICERHGFPADSDPEVDLSPEPSCCSESPTAAFSLLEVVGVPEWGEHAAARAVLEDPELGRLLPPSPPPLGPVNPVGGAREPHRGAEVAGSFGAGPEPVEAYPGWSASELQGESEGRDSLSPKEGQAEWRVGPAAERELSSSFVLVNLAMSPEP